MCACVCVNLPHWLGTGRSKGPGLWNHALFMCSVLSSTTSFMVTPLSSILKRFYSLSLSLLYFHRICHSPFHWEWQKSRVLPWDTKTLQWQVLLKHNKVTGAHESALRCGFLRNTPCERVRLQPDSPLGQCELRSQPDLCCPTCRSDYYFPFDRCRSTCSDNVCRGPQSVDNREFKQRRLTFKLQTSFQTSEITF